MTTLQQRVKELTPFEVDQIDWVDLKGGDDFEYHIDYSFAVLNVDRAAGRADFLIRWQPDAYCHFHKHLGETTMTVLEGEHHVIEENPKETVHKIRTPGHSVTNAPGDLHMEKGGPQGSTLYFGMQAKDGILFEFVGRDGSHLRNVTVDDIADSNL